MEPTPTPTADLTSCACYIFENPTEGTLDVTYTVCEGTVVTVSITSGLTVTECVQYLQPITVDAGIIHGLCAGFVQTCATEGDCSSCASVTQTPTPTPSVTGTLTPTPTVTGTLTPTPTVGETIYTHGAVRATCSDFCNTNYLVQTLDSSSAPYGTLTMGGFIYGYSGQSGFIAYSNVSTDTNTGPFRIAEIDGSGEVLGIYVCSGGSCIPF